MAAASPFRSDGKFPVRREPMHSLFSAEGSPLQHGKKFIQAPVPVKRKASCETLPNVPDNHKIKLRKGGLKKRTSYDYVELDLEDGSNPFLALKVPQTNVNSCAPESINCVEETASKRCEFTRTIQSCRASCETFTCEPKVLQSQTYQECSLPPLYPKSLDINTVDISGIPPPTVTMQEVPSKREGKPTSWVKKTFKLLTAEKTQAHAFADNSKKKHNSRFCKYQVISPPRVFHQRKKCKTEDIKGDLLLPSETSRNVQEQLTQLPKLSLRNILAARVTALTRTQNGQCSEVSITNGIDPSIGLISLSSLLVTSINNALYAYFGPEVKTSCIARTVNPTFSWQPPTEKKHNKAHLTEIKSDTTTVGFTKPITIKDASCAEEEARTVRRLDPKTIFDESYRDNINKLRALLTKNEGWSVHSHPSNYIQSINANVNTQEIFNSSLSTEAKVPTPISAIQPDCESSLWHCRRSYATPVEPAESSPSVRSYSSTHERDDHLSGQSLFDYTLSHMLHKPTLKQLMAVNARINNDVAGVSHKLSFSNPPVFPKKMSAMTQTALSVMQQRCVSETFDESVFSDFKPDTASTNLLHVGSQDYKTVQSQKKPKSSIPILVSRPISPKKIPEKRSVATETDDVPQVPYAREYVSQLANEISKQLSKFIVAPNGLESESNRTNLGTHVLTKSRELAPKELGEYADQKFINQVSDKKMFQAETDSSIEGIKEPISSCRDRWSTGSLNIHQAPVNLFSNLIKTTERADQFLKKMKSSPRINGDALQSWVKDQELSAYLDKAKRHELSTRVADIQAPQNATSTIPSSCKFGKEGECTKRLYFRAVSPPNFRPEDKINVFEPLASSTRNVPTITTERRKWDKTPNPWLVNSYGREYGEPLTTADDLCRHAKSKSWFYPLNNNV